MTAVENQEKALLQITDQLTLIRSDLRALRAIEGEASAPPEQEQADRREERSVDGDLPSVYEHIPSHFLRLHDLDSVEQKMAAYRRDALYLRTRDGLVAQFRFRDEGAPPAEALAHGCDFLEAFVDVHDLKTSFISRQINSRGRYLLTFPDEAALEAWKATLSDSVRGRAFFKKNFVRRVDSATGESLVVSMEGLYSSAEYDTTKAIMESAEDGLDRYAIPFGCKAFGYQ